MYGCGMLVIFEHKLLDKPIAKKRESAMWRDCLNSAARLANGLLLQDSGTAKISCINLHAKLAYLSSLALPKH